MITSHFNIKRHALWRTLGLMVIVVMVAVLINPCVVEAERLPQPQGYFNDFAGVASFEKDSIEAQLRQIHRDFGIEFAIVTVTDTGDLDPRSYAVALFEAWGIGGAERDTGLLLLNVIGEREILFEVGYGLEAIFTDFRTGVMLDNSLDHFRDGNYGMGYLSLIDQARIVASGDDELGPMEPPVAEPVDYLPGLVVTVVVIYLVLMMGAKVTGRHGMYRFLHQLLFIMFLRGGGRGGPRGGGGFGGFGGGRSGGGGSSRRY